MKNKLKKSEKELRGLLTAGEGGGEGVGGEEVGKCARVSE